MKPWLVLIIIIILIIAVILFGIIVFIPCLIRKTGFGRYDDNHTLHYFTHHDFEGMTQKKFSFSSNNLTLQGYLYQMDGVERKGIIVFAHGLGAGHIQYTTEIHHFAQLGYLVYTFDAQGCLNSEGKGLKYITNYPKNLDDFLTYLEENELDGETYSLVGHSLGAYGVNLMSQFHHDIDRIVSMSGFDSIEKFMGDMLSSAKSMGKLIAKILCHQEKRKNKKYYLSSSEVLANRKPEILLISGNLDSIVKPVKHFEYYKQILKEDENAHFMLVEGRAHRPLLTIEASDYDTKRNMDLLELRKRYKNKVPSHELKQYYENLDYHLLVELDDQIMRHIDRFLDHQEIEKDITIKM